LLFVHNGGLTFQEARWSLTPSYSKTLKTPYSTFNTRSEALDKPTWRPSFKSRRGLMPASLYYEWDTDENGAKRPNVIHLPGFETMMLAALYSWWHEPDAGPDDGWHLTCSMLTADSINTLNIADLHDREPIPMPLDTDLAWRWLDPEEVGTPALIDEVRAAGVQVAKRLHYYPVAPLKGDGPHLIEPLG
jgi:putative SOS response-associated peptidase YedK